MTWRIRSVRKRILLLALVPLLSLFGLYVFGTSITARNAINLARADTLKHATGQPTGTFDGMIQAERLLAVLYLAAPTPENQAKLTAIEQQVGRESAALRSALMSSATMNNASAPQARATSRRLACRRCFRRRRRSPRPDRELPAGIRPPRQAFVRADSPRCRPE